jgi:uncharacterized membrane protein
MELTEEIDYKALFEQVQHENEGIRIKYIKLKNEEVGLIDRIKDRFIELAESPYFHIYLYAGIMIFVAIIVPAVKALFQLIFRRKENEG